MIICLVTLKMNAKSKTVSLVMFVFC